MKTHETLEQDDMRWQAVTARDSRFDGRFYFAVKTTGVFCNPSCASRQALRRNVVFFETVAAAQTAGFRACKRCQPARVGPGRDALVARRLCAMLEAEPGLSLAALGQAVNLSPWHVQRLFKTQVGVSPKHYATTQRSKHLRAQLQTQQSVTRAVYEAGFNSSGQIHQESTARLGMKPGEYKHGGQAINISYSVLETALGGLLIAATTRGLVAVRFGKSAALLEELRLEFPNAKIEPNAALLAGEAETLLGHLLGENTRLDLPSDVRASAFQSKVWNALKSIPCGETRSYSEIAQGIGQPNAVRAVARACASNPIALVVPCHRVVAANGSLAGYRWGLERKAKLLEHEERTLRQPPPANTV